MTSMIHNLCTIVEAFPFWRKMQVYLSYDASPWDGYHVYIVYLLPFLAGIHGF